MERYLSQLHADIEYSITHLNHPCADVKTGNCDWVSEDEEDRQAPVRNLQEVTGIQQEMLPPAAMLSDAQLHLLLEALKKLLDAYNWIFVLQIAVPESIQYETIRNNFDQPIKLKCLHMGFFRLCQPGTAHEQCALKEYCHCKFFDEMFGDMVDEELTPEEERARALEIEVSHIKRKYGDDWMKYYPYHLDKEHDDIYGNPYDYGCGDDEEEDGL